MQFRLYFLLILIAIGGCERPFSEPERPRVIVLQPDLTTVQPEKQIQIAVRIDGPFSAEHVVLDEDTLTYDPDGNAWHGEHVFTDGLNRLVFAVTDADQRTNLDTVYALQDYLTFARSTPHLPSPRGGHTATTLGDGRIVVIGGAPSTSDDAVRDGLYLSDGLQEFVPLEDELNVPRMGHTATLLPDGRVLIMGGSRRHDVASLDDLVETAELYDPGTDQFTVVSVDGDPVRRAYHTATLHEEDGAVYVDLYGGIGDVSYESPTIGTRADVRRFQLRGDSLVALDPAPGPQLDVRVSGHTQLEVRPNTTGPRRFLISGAYYSDGNAQIVSLELEYRPSVGLLQFYVSPMQTLRRRHAAALLDEGFVGHFGGMQESPNDLVAVPEIYSAVAQQYFRYPEDRGLMSRYGHTATKVQNRRILLLGGFLSSGEGVVTSERYRIPDFHTGVNTRIGPMVDRTK